MRYLALVALACLLSAIAWWSFSADSPSSSEVLRGSTDAQPPQAEEPAAELVGDLSPVAVANSRALLKETDSAAPSSPETHPWAGQLASVTGRILEASGAPAAGLSVTLMELDVDVVTYESLAATPRGGLDVGQGVTDADGRFKIDGARGTGFHLLAIASGEPRATLRLVEQSLVDGGVTDIGDFHLSASGTVVGRVLDEAGTPVGGARVRLSPLFVSLLAPQMGGQLDQVAGMLAQSGALALRSDCLVSMGQAQYADVIDLPRWVMGLVDRLPLSTTKTGADGSFRLEGVAVGSIIGGVDLAGHVPTLFDHFTLEAGAEHSVGDVQLLTGRTVRGRVVDSLGAGVASVPVFAGAVSQSLPYGVLQPAGLSDEDGGFAVAGVPETGQVIGAARRSSLDRWTMGTDAENAAGLVVTLDRAMPLEVQVVSTSGEPVEGARFQRFRDEDGHDLAEGMTRVTGGQAAPMDVPEVLGPGRYRLRAVPLGQWWFLVSADGYQASMTSHGRESAGAPLSIRLEPARPLALHVVAEATGEPVVGAHLSVVGPIAQRFVTFTSAFTDAHGEAQVERVPLDPPAEEDAGRAVSTLTVIVDHPKFGRWTRRLDEVRELYHASPKGALTIRLLATGAIAGRVLRADGPPPERYTVYFSPKDGISELPELASTAANGAFEISGLAPGTYRVVLTRRMGDMNPILGLASMSSLQVEYEQELVVRSGATTDLTIGLDAKGEAKPGWIEGTVTLDGLPLPGAYVNISSMDGRGAPDLELVTDADGRFRTDPINGNAKRLRVTLETIDATAEGGVEEVVTRFMSAGSGSATTLDIRLMTHSLTLSVTDALTGEPLGDVSVLHGGVVGLTDDAGLASIDFRRLADTHERRSTVPIMLRKDGYAPQRVNDAGTTNGDRLQIGMRPNLKVNGRLEGAAGPGLVPVLFVRSTGGGSSYTTDRGTLDAVTGEFSFSVPDRGWYRMEFQLDGQQRSATVRVPEGGASDLVVQLKPL